MAKRHMRNEQFYNRHCRTLPELRIGDFVQIQNQDGHYPRRWTKTGRIVETCGNRQYQVRVDGSNRITLRNRRFLRKIYPVVDGPHCSTPETLHPPMDSELPQQRQPDEAMDTDENIDIASPGVQHESEEGMEVDDVPSAAEGDVGECLHPFELPPLRQRSCRRIRAPRTLSPQMRGQSHEYSDAYKP